MTLNIITVRQNTGIADLKIADVPVILVDTTLPNNSTNIFFKFPFYNDSVSN